MGSSLLARSREIAGLLHITAGSPVDFQEMARVIANTLECGVYIVGRRGHIIGYSFLEDPGPQPGIESILGYAERFPESFNQEFLGLQVTRANLHMERRCIFNVEGISCSCQGKIFSIVPIFGGARRIGTLVLYREREFTEEELVLAEYGALVIASEVMRMRGERIGDEARQRASVNVALGTLSFSEREAIEHILAELNAREGLLVASRVADRAGITRSVIASALRKLESAGLIQARSLGMKGTYIRILNDNLLDAIGKN
ncbi:MAG: GTP-sensing pleiotropic transcriptional regulator CodY [Syntrophomonadaceae bacterium]|nr:GTP-sensing pleiotropic transcriptional regulator CodY [Syntrophomonadaceae bacterium]